MLIDSMLEIEQFFKIILIVSLDIKPIDFLDLTNFINNVISVTLLIKKYGYLLC